MKTIYDKEAVQIRLKYVLQVIDNDISIADAARNANVAWRTMKRWVTWFEIEGVSGLQNKPRGITEPVDEDTRGKIIELKRENRCRSGRKIRDLLKERHDIEKHRQTVWRILKESGENKRQKRSFKIYHDFERPRPNSLWQVDFMDAIVVEGVGLVYLLVFIDDHSRKITGARFVKTRSEQHVLELLWQSICHNGMPSQIYSDQGTQFKCYLGKGFTRFEKVCKRLGIGPIFASVSYPEGKGKIERLFGFVQDDFLTEYIFTDLEDMSGKFDEWVQWYNEMHEHSSLGGKPPNSRYRNFKPRMPEGDMFDIFAEHALRKVRKNATISFQGQIYPVDPKYVHEKVEVLMFGNDIKIYGRLKLLAEYDSGVDYHEKMLRRTYTRLVRKDGAIKFRNVRYYIGSELAGQRVEVVIIRDQLRAFLSSKRLLIFKLGEGDAVLINADRSF